MKKHLQAVVILVSVIASPTFNLARADKVRKVVVGVNVAGVQYLNADQQDTLIEQLQQNGVKVVRTGIGPEYKRFIIHAYEHGIRSLVGIDPAVGSKNVRMRHYDLSVGLAWDDAEFSTIDPNAFGVWISSQVAALESAGVRLKAFELGNEVNLAGDDGDFPIHATGRVLGLADLNNPKDPEGAILAAGYRVFLKVLAELKRVRDGSKLNQTTPIIAAGLADPGPPLALGSQV